MTSKHPRTLLILTFLVLSCSKPAEETARVDTNAVPAAPPPVASPTPQPALPPLVSGGRRLAPVDEAAKSPSFAAFRSNLQRIVREKDAAALLEVVDPKIRTGFGPEGGIDSFKKQWKLDSATSPLWSELETILSLGGRLEEHRFVAPYVYAAWPEDVDAFENLAAVCPATLVYGTADTKSSAIARLDYSIVGIGPDDPMRKGDRDPKFRQIILPDGQTAWAEDRCVRSNVDYRAAFAERDGKWTMVFLVAGD